MANRTGEASAISVPELVQQDRVSDWTRLGQGRSLGEQFGRVSEMKLMTAIDEKHEKDGASDARRSQRWRALDRLLRVSFGLISPAYLFNSFPPSD